MPIYEANDYEPVINRIKNKIACRNIKMGNVLSENDILRFEEHCNAKLPQAYRMFLKEVGDGCIMLDGFQLKQLNDMDLKDLSHPFRFENPWIWEDEPNSKDNSRIEEMEHNVYHGEIELINLGDSMSYHLIVTGNCRGEVWHFTDVGIQPCCERQDFLGWFELWLDQQDETDYFKDYIY